MTSSWDPAFGRRGPAPRPNRLAIVALVVGVFGVSPPMFLLGALLGDLWSVLYFGSWALATGLGVTAYRQIARSAGAESGYSMAILGIVLGSVGLLTAALLLAYWALAAGGAA